ncbi:MAG TPA: phosphoribosylformylglycinamidine cyclo-ligase [Bacteroidota bacterium]|nr:phosphoribosylformylglycinamidine cyclo-ligase [Bacteroidota bacterium]
MATTYYKAGVNIAAGDGFVDRIKKKVRSTFSPSVLNDIGLFGAIYDANFRRIKNPVLISSVDGVGTKLKVAFLLEKHDTIGQDLVNHCVNDIAVCGAKPLFFLDYFATSKLNLAVAESVISGMVKSCRENQCSLIGGETAEMPGFYREGEYDLAGMIVGVAERNKIFDGKRVQPGDVLIGLPSSGLHTNGYSLARTILFERFEVDDYVDELEMRVGEALLSIHRSYLKIIQTLIKYTELHAMSHITGGGILGNTMRVVRKGLSARIDWHSWERPPVFNLIQKFGNVPETDMRKTFNLGVGIVFVVSKNGADKLIRVCRKNGEHAMIIGEVVKK